MLFGLMGIFGGFTAEERLIHPTIAHLLLISNEPW